MIHMKQTRHDSAHWVLLSGKVLPPSGWEADRRVSQGDGLTSVVAAGILQRLALVDAVKALTAAVEVGGPRAPGDPAACSRDSGGAW